jgi:translation initiation factor 2 beta subunit (eIF-2beta)/eIF-5
MLQRLVIDSYGGKITIEKDRKIIIQRVYTHNQIKNENERYFQFLTY